MIQLSCESRRTSHSLRRLVYVTNDFQKLVFVQPLFGMHLSILDWKERLSFDMWPFCFSSGVLRRNIG